MTPDQEQRLAEHNRDAWAVGRLNLALTAASCYAALSYRPPVAVFLAAAAVPTAAYTTWALRGFVRILRS